MPQNGEPMEQINLMNELFKILLESLRRQAFSVTLLVCACMWMNNQMEKREAKSEATIEVISKNLEDCNKSRTEQSVTIARLETRMSFLEANRKNR